MGHKLDQKIECKACGKKYHMITPQHLYKHGLTIDDYKLKYPDATLKAESMIVRTKRTQNDLFKKNQEEGEKSILEQIEKSPKMKEIKKNSNLEIEELKPSTSNFMFNENDDKYKNMNKEKILILKYLSSKFLNVENNFFIEKIAPHGRVDFRLITDISIPDEKIDVEFPNAFWHNFDMVKSTRDSRLKSIGWRIINIDSKMPTPENVEEELKKNNLI
jgi:hypothetical protein